MNTSIRFTSTLARVMAIVTLSGLVALTSQTAWAQRGNVRNVRSKQAVSGGKHLSSPRRRSAGAAAKRVDMVAGRRSAGPQSNARPGSSYLHWPIIEGEGPARTQSHAGQRRLNPGRDSATNSASQRRQGGGGIFNDGGTVTRQSSFFGQDQETGEIIDFRANLKNVRRAAGEPHSVVNSEGWDEVPEHLMFGFRARNANRSRFGLGPVRSHRVNSPRDAASGMATGKRQ